MERGARRKRCKQKVQFMTAGFHSKKKISTDRELSMVENCQGDGVNDGQSSRVVLHFSFSTV